MSTLPLIPDGDQAREWAERELADPSYRVAEPTAFDRLARDVADALADLFTADGAGGWGPWLAVAAIAVAAALLILALVVFVRPRRRAPDPAGRVELFDPAAGILTAQWEQRARAAATRGEWDDAVLAGFHAVAAALADHDAIESPPGTTAQAVARAGIRTHPTLAPALRSAADAFDDVRYLRRAGDPDSYERTAAALRAVRTAVGTPA